MSGRILVKEDMSGTNYFVEYWLTKKGNMAWRIGENLYVKLSSGYTSMLVNGEWKRSNMHTTAKVPSAAAPEEPIQTTKITTRLVL